MISYEKHLRNDPEVSDAELSIGKRIDERRAQLSDLYGQIENIAKGCKVTYREGIGVMEPRHFGMLAADIISRESSVHDLESILSASMSIERYTRFHNAMEDEMYRGK